MLVSVYICILNSVVIIPSIPGVLTMWLYYPPLFRGIQTTSVELLLWKL